MARQMIQRQQREKTLEFNVHKTKAKWKKPGRHRRWSPGKKESYTEIAASSQTTADRQK